MMMMMMMMMMMLLLMMMMMMTLNGDLFFDKIRLGKNLILSYLQNQLEKK
jgi:hypothetical protein